MNTNIFQIDYDYNDYTETQITSITKDLATIPSNIVRWVDIRGDATVENMDDLCTHFDFHPLIKNDILKIQSRPKIDDYDFYIFMTINVHEYNSSRGTFDAKKICIILGENYVITYSKDSDKIFETVKTRMEKYITHIQRHGADYLFYFILDTIMDSYFAVLEQLSASVDEFEDATIANPTKESLHALQHLRRQTLYLNKSFWPLREILGYLERGDATLISAPIKTYMRGLYEHIIQVIDTTEAQRELLSGVMDIYLSSVSNRMNEIMKVLTIISTVFMPLSFIASFYGMNFVHMPELYYTYSYPIVIGIMLVVFVGMIRFFRRKNWW